jgi:hypothetical protein
MAKAKRTAAKRRVPPVQPVSPKLAGKRNEPTTRTYSGETTVQPKKSKTKSRRKA